MLFPSLGPFGGKTSASEKCCLGSTHICLSGLWCLEQMPQMRQEDPLHGGLSQLSCLFSTSLYPITYPRLNLCILLWTVLTPFSCPPSSEHSCIPLPILVCCQDSSHTLYSAQVFPVGMVMLITPTAGDSSHNPHMAHSYAQTDWFMFVCFVES